MTALALAVASYAVLTPAAANTDPDLSVQMAMAALAPTLTYSGSDVTITGSIDHVFGSSALRGPNRTAKTDRQRIIPDISSFAQGFEAARTELAAARTEPAPRPTATPMAGESVAVAALEPTRSSALDAINAMSSPDQVVPMPMSTSSALAFARENVTSEPAQLPSAKLGERELWCLATAIYFEARGEAYRGQVAVAQVVMNRTKHRLYPDTVCGVVFQNQHMRNACQFSFACDGIPETIRDQRSWRQAQDIAKDVVDGKLYLTEVAEATHYHATYVYPHWAPKMTKLTKIGLHVFYRFKRGWQFG